MAKTKPKAKRSTRPASSNTPRSASAPKVTSGEAPDADAATTRERPIAKLPRSPRLRFALGTIACFYFATVWLDGVGSPFPQRNLPRAWVYFSQIAALFRFAGMAAIDYRAEGWSCSEHRWVEVDTRPFFQVDRDNKENRFERALQFYRRERQVMHALEDYVIGRYNATADHRIGGVRFSSLRVPYPKPGAHVSPYERKPLASFPTEYRHDWYWTPKSRRAERCGDKAPPPDPKEDDEMKSAPPGSSSSRDPKDFAGERE